MRRKSLRTFSPFRAPGLWGLAFGVLLLFLTATVSHAAAPEGPAPPASTAVPAAQTTLAPLTPTTAPAARTTAAPPVSAAIPMAEVATRATEVSSFLGNLYTQFAPSDDIEEIEKELPDLGGRMAMELRRTTKFLQAQPSLDTLQSAQQLWHKRQAQTGKWLVYLTQRATQLQAALSRLDDLQKRWRLTLDATRKEQAPETIIQQVGALIPAIEAAQRAIQEQSSSVLNLQGRVAEEAAQCGAALTEISQAQQAAVGKLTSRQRLPIWNAELWILARAQGFSRLDKIAAAPWEDITHYLSRPDGGMPAHLVFFVFLSGLFWWMRVKVRRWPTGEGTAAIATVIDRPFAAALIGALLFATSPYSPEPPTVRNLLSVLAVAAMIRLMKPAVDPPLVAKLYTLGILFAIDTVRHTFTGASLLNQMLVIVESLAGMAVLAKSLAYCGWRAIGFPDAGRVRLRDLPGRGRYRRLVRPVPGWWQAPWGTCRWHGSRCRAFSMAALGRDAFRHHQDTARRDRFRPSRQAAETSAIGRQPPGPPGTPHPIVLTWVATSAGRPVSWTMSACTSRHVCGPGSACRQLERGSISLSLEDVLAFVLTVWAAYLLSAFIRFVLQEDVYPRRKSRGHRLCRLASAELPDPDRRVCDGDGDVGVDLTKVTVMLSAFGVGIGFGLQSVVNNFVSGLILLFERPIHLGDTVEVGGLLGQVRRIGIRASVVRTRQGAEIIVPNSQLISKQVTNWTFSDQLRRIELPVGVNYDAAPQRVIEVIESVAAAHPKVSKNPPPQALVTGFGDSSINFELRAWTDQYIGWNRIRSELAVAVYDAVHAAGFSFPFPQREVRLLQDNEA